MLVKKFILSFNGFNLGLLYLLLLLFPLRYALFFLLFLLWGKTEEIEEKEEKLSKKNSNIQEYDSNDTLKNTIEFTKKKIVKKNIEDIDLPNAIETDFQKSGYCFVGKLNDVRYCSEVSAKNKCMSGEIFPSMDLCINPNIK